MVFASTDEKVEVAVALIFLFFELRRIYPCLKDNVPFFPLEKRSFLERMKPPLKKGVSFLIWW